MSISDRNNITNSKNKNKNNSVSKALKWFNKNNGSLRATLHRNKSSKSTNSTPKANSPRSPLSPLETPRNKEEEFKQVFGYFDSDGDGKISALEIRSYFGSIGEYMSHEDAQSVIDLLDSDGDSFLDFQDFLKLMKKDHDHDQELNNNENVNNNNNNGNSNVNMEFDEDIKRAFEMFEMEKGSGCITPKSLQRALNRLGDARSYDECVVMLSVFDSDGNGVLDFHEFHQMMA